MPPLRRAAKSTKSTTESSVGRRRSIAAGVKDRDRYQITPHTDRPQTTLTSRISNHARNLGVTLLIYSHQSSDISDQSSVFQFAPPARAELTIDNCELNTD